MRIPLLDWLRQDLAYAFRGIARSPGFAAMVVVTLALGVGANAAVFSLVDKVFGSPAGVRGTDALRRLYVASPAQLSEQGTPVASPFFNYPGFSAIEAAIDGEGSLMAWTPSSERTIRVGESEVPVRASWVTHDFFDVLRVGALRGRVFGAPEERIDLPARVAVISHGLWERVFGLDPQVLGRSIALDDTTYTVIGISEDGFTGLDLSLTEIFFPLSTFPGASAIPGLPWYEWGSNYLRVASRLAEGGDERSLAARATTAYQRQPPIERYSFDTTAVVLAGSIVEARGPGVQDQAIPISARIAGVTSIVLLIACANAASLLLVRATRRRREIAIRLALGVSRRRLLSQFLVESLVLAVVAGSAALALAGWGGEFLRRLLLPAVQWAEPVMDIRTLMFVGATAIGAGLLTGLLPAVLGRQVNVNSTLKAGVREGGTRRVSARGMLLVAQTALSIVLLVGAGLFVRSLGEVDALPLGYEVDELVRGTLSARAEPAAVREASLTIAQIAGVNGVALASSPPMSGYESELIYLPGREAPLELGPRERPTYIQVSPEFFEVTGIRLLEGRTFSAGESSGVAIINETMARAFFPGESPIGRCLAFGSPGAACTEVVGVTENFRRTQVIEEPTAQYFRPLTDRARLRSIVVRAIPAAARDVEQEVRARIDREFEPGIARVERMSDALEPQLRPWRLGAQLFTAFGLLALLVTVVGIYSVTSYTVSQRTHEMGVRIALGARAADVLRLVVGEGLGVIATGLVLGIGIALALGRLIESLLFGVTPRDPAAMVAAAAVLLVVGVTASLVPAWRAGRVDPVTTLSAE